MNIKAIETRYAGCRFRSRLEARWAVFFDHLKWTWEYESQGFVVGDGHGRPYLPDFLIKNPISGASLWVEVKGSDKTLDVDLLGDAVSTGADINSILILGPVPKTHPTPAHAVVRKIFGHRAVHKVVITPTRLLQVGREYGLASPDVLGPLVGAANVSPSWRLPDVTLEHSVRSAYEAARSARFEHGESG